MAGATRVRPGRGLLPLDWGALGPLRVRAAAVADGVYAGAHRSTRRGAGIEFGGQRPYVAGDDLRFLDRRSLMRHDRLMVREFETDTERAVWLALDASASMGFRGASGGARGAKLAYAGVMAAALCRIATGGQDPVGLAWLGAPHGRYEAPARAGFGQATFERIVDSLERAEARGALADDLDALERQLGVLARRARRGSVVVLFSDFLDLPDEVRRLVGVLASERVLVGVQVLDPVEAELGFAGRVKLRELEGTHVVTTDVERVRGEYLERLEQQTSRWRAAIEFGGGRLVRSRTDVDPIVTVRAVVQAIGEARR